MTAVHTGVNEHGAPGVLKENPNVTSSGTANDVQSQRRKLANDIFFT